VAGNKTTVFLGCALHRPACRTIRGDLWFPLLSVSKAVETARHDELGVVNLQYAATPVMGHCSGGAFMHGASDETEEDDREGEAACGEESGTKEDHG
jgi:hypothetical protein